MGERGDGKPAEFDPDHASISSRRAFEQDHEDTETYVRGVQKARETGHGDLVESQDEVVDRIAEQADGDLPGEAEAHKAKRSEQLRIARENRLRKEEALKVKAGEALLDQLGRQKPEAFAAAAAAEQAAHIPKSDVPRTEDQAIAQADANFEKLQSSKTELKPDPRDMMYGTLLAAFAVEGKGFEPPEGIDAIEEEFTQYYNRVAGLLADVQGTLRVPNLHVDSSSVDLLKECNDELTVIKKQRRLFKESFRESIAENKLKRARLILDTDLKSIGHPADTVIAKTPADIKSDATLYAKLNFYQARLEQVLRRYTR